MKHTWHGRKVSIEKAKKIKASDEDDGEQYRSFWKNKLYLCRGVSVMEKTHNEFVFRFYLIDCSYQLMTKHNIIKN